MATVTIRPWGFDMVIECAYEAAEDIRDTPNCVVDKVFVNGEDIYEMLDNHQIERIEEHCLRKLED